MSFKAHPDFENLKKVYDVTASSYFRRGSFYGSPSDYFVDIVETFKEVFLPAKLIPKKKMLIAGIGDSQETFSYLATIKSLVKGKPLADTVDLHVIDLQSKPISMRLKEQAFFEYPHEPEFARTSFIPEKRQTRFGNVEYYRVNDEILDFVENSYNNPQKSQWERRLQEAMPEYEPESFDIISINNTLGYIKEDNVRYGALKDVLNILKKDGIFITDPFYEPRMKKAGVADAFKEIKEGINQKII